MRDRNEVWGSHWTQSLRTLIFLLFWGKGSTDEKWGGWLILLLNDKLDKGEECSIGIDHRM